MLTGLEGPQSMICGLYMRDVLISCSGRLSGPSLRPLMCVLHSAFIVWLLLLASGVVLDSCWQSRNLAYKVLCDS